MKNYIISYYLDDFYHTHTQEAKNMVEAIEKAMKRIPETSRSLFHDLKVEESK